MTDERDDYSAPDPGSVSTVADLARELRALRIYRGRLSVRDIDRRTRALVEAQAAGCVRVAHSTVGDALGGKRGLPRQENLTSIVRALGVDDAEVRLWVQAWRRAAADHEKLPARVPRTSVPEARQRQATARPAQISAVNATSGARLIETLDTHEVVEQLVAMQPDAAAARLNLVEATRVAEVLIEMDERAAAQMLGLARQDHAGAALAMMPAAHAGVILSRFDHHQRPGVVHHVPTAPLVEIIAQCSAGLDTLVHWNASAKDWVRVLAEMPREQVSNFLTGEGGNSGAGLLFEAIPDNVTKLVTAVAASRAAGWLSALGAEQLTAVALHIADQDLLPILEELDPRQHCRMLVTALGVDRIVPLISQLSRPRLPIWYEEMYRTGANLPGFTSHHLDKLREVKSRH